MNRKDSNLKKRISSIDNMIKFIDDKHKVITEARFFLGNELMSKSSAFISQEGIKGFQQAVAALLIRERKHLKEMMGEKTWDTKASY